MLFIITFILATASLFAYLFAKSFINPNRSFAKLAITLTSLISFLLIIVCISTIILSVKYTNEIKLSDEVKSSQNIVNIKDNRDTEGGFLSGVAKLMPNNTIITTIKLIAIVTKSTRLMLMIAK